MALKERSPAEAQAFCKAAGVIAASVTIKASMVAISGAIMPEPLAMPEMVTVLPAISQVALAPLAKVSVVRMALAASSQLAVPDVVRASNCEMRHDVSSGSPITPVEEVAICVSGTCNFVARAAVSVDTASSPTWPVKAFALPAFTNSARI